MTPSKKADGPTAGSQLALPGAPKFDRFGLHAEDCECARCGLGYRPSKEERRLAEQVHARAERARREEEAKRAAGAATPGVSPAEAKHRRHHERMQAGMKATREYLERLSAPVVRPATEEELAEMRREFALRFKRKDGRR